MLKLTRQIFREIDRMNTGNIEEESSATSVRDYINSINSMASNLMVEASTYIVNIANKIFITLIKNLTEGDDDLTKRVDAKTKDEFGILAGFINTFIDNV